MSPKTKPETIATTTLCENLSAQVFGSQINLIFDHTKDVGQSAKGNAIVVQSPWVKVNGTGIELRLIAIRKIRKES